MSGYHMQQTGIWVKDKQTDKTVAEWVGALHYLDEAKGRIDMMRTRAEWWEDIEGLDEWLSDMTYDFDPDHKGVGFKWLFSDDNRLIIVVCDTNIDREVESPVENKSVLVEDSRSLSKAILHICRTGKKGQYYTLYHEGIIENGHLRNYFCDYNGNLSLDLEKAYDKALERFEDMVNSKFYRVVELQYWETPRQIYNKMEAFGTEFKTAKSGKVMWANATQEFWTLWREKKAEIKEAGFWVKRTDSGDWLVFVKCDPEFANHR